MASQILRDFAHSRSGDKGNLNTLSLIAYRLESYSLLVDEVTADRVKSHLGFRVVGRVLRYECPTLRTLHFVVEKAQTDTVTTSTFADTHGKSLSSALLEMPISIAEPPA